MACSLQFCCSAIARGGAGLPPRRRLPPQPPPPPPPPPPQSSRLHRFSRSLRSAALSVAPPPTPANNTVSHQLGRHDVEYSYDDDLLSGLSPKEQTLLLKRQKDWRRALRLFDRLRSRAEYAPNAIHYNVVIRTLGRARRWDELRRCWLDMAKDGILPTNNTYATLMDVYGKAGLVKEALLWLRHMKARGISPDEVTMNTVVRILKDAEKFDEAERFFKDWCNGNVEFDFLDLDLEASNSISPKHFLLTELLRTGGRAPLSVISSNTKDGPRKPRLAATYNTLIDLYGKAGRLNDASDAFAEMLRSGIVPDTITFNTMINICGSNGLLSEAESLLAKMEERGVAPDPKTFNIFMSMYAALGKVEEVVNYFKKINNSPGLSPDIVSYRIILHVMCKNSMVREVEDVISKMLESGTQIDEQSVPVIMKMYIDQGLTNGAKDFFQKHCTSMDISSNNYAAIMNAYAERGLWKEAEDIFYDKREMENKKDIVEYNVLLKAYGKGKLYDKALSLFEDMRNHGIWPDDCTYNSLVQMLSAGDLCDKARELLGRMKEAGFKPRCQTFSSVIASYSRKLMISEAIEIYQEMKELGVEPNEVVYGSLVDMFAETGRLEEAYQYVNFMEKSGLEVNQIIMTSLIKAYSKVSLWKEAQELYTKMKNLGDGPDVIASNCMINLYASLGMVSEAKLIFDSLRSSSQADGISYATMMYLYRSMGMLEEANDIGQEVQKSGLLTHCALYNSVISCYAINGKLRDCAELLHQMLAQSIAPDASTFKTIFTVLKKGGIPFEAVSELEFSYNEGDPNGVKIIIASLFSMVDLHAYALEYCDPLICSGISLNLCAYNVAIFVYGASGNTDKALNLYMRMQDDGLKPNLVTYIYLAGCYGKAGMVEGLRRIYSLLKYGELHPNEALYKALIDAYQNAGRNDLAEMVDQEMKFCFQKKDDDSGDEYNLAM